MAESIDVSIVIPAYNSEAFLKRSVLSCLAQVGVTCEVIVVDDGSKDFTRDILESIRNSNPDCLLVNVFQPENRGQASARNEGIKRAQGRYVAFLDSDDAICSTGVMRQWVQDADKHSLEMLIGRFYNVSPAMVRTKARQIDLKPFGIYSISNAPQLANVVSCWQILYSRAFLIENDVFFSPKLRQREDRLFVLEALLKAERVSVTDQFCVDHFNVENSTMKTIDAGQLEQYVQHLVEMNEAFQKARADLRSNPDFERANAIVYLHQLDDYWGRICQRLFQYERHREMIRAYLSQLRTMVSDLPLLYVDGVLDVGLKNGFLLEGRMDILRLALKAGDDSRLMRIVQNKMPPISEIYDLRDVDSSAEEVVTRYWSFRRDIKVGARANPVSKLKEQVKRVIIHTGLPKTGSSSLQQLMERNRYLLLEQGVHYPSFGANREYGIRRERTPGHASFFQHVVDGNSEHALSALASEVQELNQLSGARIDTLVLSAENIVSQRFWDNGQDFDDIVKIFEGIELHTVCVLRHPLSWFASLYTEMSGNPWNNFVDSPEKFEKSLSDLGLFDFKAIQHTLAAPDHVHKSHIGVFEDIRKMGGIENWFFNLFEIDASNFAGIDEGLRNDSLSAAQAMLIRSIKRIKGLGRNDLAKAFEWVRDEPEVFGIVNQKAPTSRMAVGLAHVKEKQALEIEFYQDAYGVSAPTFPEACQVDFESAQDLIIERLEEVSDAPQTDVAPFLKRLDRMFDDANHERILQVTREDRAVLIQMNLEPGEAAQVLKVIDKNGEQQIPLFDWEGASTTILDASYLEALWKKNVRDLELEISSDRKVGRRPFRLVKLLCDGSIWPVPPAFISRLEDRNFASAWA